MIKSLIGHLLQILHNKYNVIYTLVSYLVFILIHREVEFYCPCLFDADTQGNTKLCVYLLTNNLLLI